MFVEVCGGKFQVLRVGGDRCERALHFSLVCPQRLVYTAASPDRGPLDVGEAVSPQWGCRRLGIWVAFIACPD